MHECLYWVDAVAAADIAQYYIVFAFIALCLSILVRNVWQIEFIVFNTQFNYMLY